MTGNNVYRKIEFTIQSNAKTSESNLFKHQVGINDISLCRSGRKQGESTFFNNVQIHPDRGEISCGQCAREEEDIVDHWLSLPPNE